MTTLENLVPNEAWAELSTEQLQRDAKRNLEAVRYILRRLKEAKEEDTDTIQVLAEEHVEANYAYKIYGNEVLARALHPEAAHCH